MARSRFWSGIDLLLSDFGLYRGGLIVLGRWKGLSRNPLSSPFFAWPAATVANITHYTHWTITDWVQQQIVGLSSTSFSKLVSSKPTSYVVRMRDCESQPATIASYSSQNNGLLTELQTVRCCPSSGRRRKEETTINQNNHKREGVEFVEGKREREGEKFQFSV